MVADSSFAALDLLASLAPRMTCITRLRLDAQLYEPTPLRRPGMRGRARKKGARLPALSAVLADAQTRWQRLVVPRWYAQASRPIDIASGTAVWYHAGLAALPLRWVLIRDPLGCFYPQALLCTQPELEPPLDVVQYFVQRWQVEVTSRGGAPTSRAGDPAPVVRPGHRPHDAGAAGALFAGHAAGHAAGARRHVADPASRLVPQDLADL